MLLIKFVEKWRSFGFTPDIVTGWNIETFDIPYLVNRIRKILGETFVKNLSPFGILVEGSVPFNGREQQVYYPAGISILDYLQLYKKFSYTPQESYKLDYIASQELNEKKLDYSEYSSLNELYIKNPQKYIEYNVKDVLLVERLEDKLGLIELVVTIAYDARVNYNDAFITVKLWDVIIHNHLLNNKGVVVPQYKRESKGNSISGGYVKDPQIGRHNWTVSFDLTSLYPHLIIGFNISPETYRGSYEIPTSKENYIDLILSGYMDNIRPELLKNNFTMSGLGCFFTRDFRGFLPELMKKLFEERKIYKKKMLDAKKAMEKAKAEGKSKEAIYELEKLAAKYKNLQQARKINLNGAYGALSNPYFRWFDDILAESVTMSGQLSIRWIEKKLHPQHNNNGEYHNHCHELAEQSFIHIFSKVNT